MPIGRDLVIILFCAVIISQMIVLKKIWLLLRDWHLKPNAIPMVFHRYASTQVLQVSDASSSSAQETVMFGNATVAENRSLPMHRVKLH